MSWNHSQTSCCSISKLNLFIFNSYSSQNCFSFAWRVNEKNIICLCFVVCAVRLWCGVISLPPSDPLVSVISFNYLWCWFTCFPQTLAHVLLQTGKQKTHSANGVSWPDKCHRSRTRTGLSWLASLCLPIFQSEPPKRQVREIALLTGTVNTWFTGNCFVGIHVVRLVSEQWTLRSKRAPLNFSTEIRHRRMTINISIVISISIGDWIMNLTKRIFVFIYK